MCDTPRKIPVVQLNALQTEPSEKEKKMKKLANLTLSNIFFTLHWI